MTPADAMRDLETTVCEGGEFGCVCMKGVGVGCGGGGDTGDSYIST